MSNHLLSQLFLSSCLLNVIFSKKKVSNTYILRINRHCNKNDTRIIYYNIKSTLYPDPNLNTAMYMLEPLCQKRAQKYFLTFFLPFFDVQLSTWFRKKKKRREC